LESRGGQAGSRIFWPVESHGQGPVTDAADDRLQWVRAEDAVDALVRATDRRVIRTFVADPAPRRPVVLVRHARAGKRGRWAGRDEDRPLDRRGRAQADALVELLTGYQVERIHSSDARRCLDTVGPLADALSIPVDENRLLGESAALADPAGARTTLVRLVREPGRAVICGQRKSLDVTLPTLMAEIGVSSNVVAPRKGGVLVLHLAENGARTVVEAFEPLA
jgi:8-oxo-dGTP diphosphatase